MVSIEVDDTDGAYQQLQREGFETVYPSTDEAWGVRRFFARDPGGALIKLVMHC